MVEDPRPRFSDRHARAHRRRRRAERSAARVRGRAVEPRHGVAFRRRRRHVAARVHRYAARAAAVLLQPSRGRSEKPRPHHLGFDVPHRLQRRRPHVEAPHRCGARRQPRHVVVARRRAAARRQRRRRDPQPQRRRVVVVPRPHPARPNLPRGPLERETVFDLRRPAGQQLVVCADDRAQRYRPDEPRLVRDHRRRRDVRDPRSRGSQLHLEQHAGRRARHLRPHRAPEHRRLAVPARPVHVARRRSRSRPTASTGTRRSRSHRRTATSRTSAATSCSRRATAAATGRRSAPISPATRRSTSACPAVRSASTCRARNITTRRSRSRPRPKMRTSSGPAPTTA